MAVASVGLAVVNLSVVGFGEVGGRIQAPSVSINGKKLRAVLANVNHGNHGYERLYKLVRYTGPDIVVLLEVNSSWMQALEPLRNIYPYSYGKLQDEQGIALLSRIPFENAVITIIDDVGLPSLIARFKIGRQPLTLIGTHPYAPSSSARAEQRNRQLSAVARFIADQKGPVVLIGDLNITPWSPFFADFLRDSGLRDTRNGFGLQPTWPAGFSALIPIDHCLVSPHVQVHHREVGPNIGSDHYPVVIDFSLPHP